MTTMALCISAAYHKSSKGRQDKKGVLQRRGPSQQTCTVSGVRGGGIRLTHAIMNCVHHREPAHSVLSCLDTASASSIWIPERGTLLNKMMGLDESLFLLTSYLKRFLRNKAGLYFFLFWKLMFALNLPCLLF